MSKRIWVLMAVMTCLGTGISFGQVTANGTLNVTATIQGSINLVFVTNGSGVTLTGSGTNTATLPFGTVRMYGGAPPANVTRTLNGTTSFDISTPFDVEVTKANSASATYTLTAQLGSADLVNTWTLDTDKEVTDTAPVELTSTGAWGVGNHSLAVTIPASNNSGSVSNSIVFAATAN